MPQINLYFYLLFFKENDGHIKMICYGKKHVTNAVLWACIEPEVFLEKSKLSHICHSTVYCELCAPSGFEQFWGQKCFSCWLFGGKSRWYVLPRVVETFSLGATYSSYFTTWTGSQQLHRRNKEVCFPEVLCLLFKSCARTHFSLHIYYAG